MKTAVLLKQTFDTEEKIVFSNGTIAEENAKFVINPYDEYALEEALRLKEIHGGEVIAVTYGPERAEEALRTALALGADEAVLIEQDGQPEDSSLIAALLAATLQPMSPDLVLAGLFAVDSGSGSVALQAAERLGLPHASSAVKIEVVPADDPRLHEKALHPEADELTGAPNASLVYSERYALIERDVEGDSQHVAVPLPVLITAQQGLNEPRYPSLPGIMKAKRKPLKRVSAESIAQAASVSLAAARTERTELLPPAPRAAGRKLSGSAAEQAHELAGLLAQAGVVKAEP
ncbi:electron transfer flavoprotein subunit beta/FixA family protein [Paenibacillus protaetiae]|uniref:Electron transfer flavoprotein subunit beta n=1 Tax=Paenibacillus protaetiae TaxID=2509456 RepID=A0A4P6F0C0_9BACL|nr:electron transfer flavoprotein subunit beta/FixA family protein [Paenibacillus protaetiae]QAY68495.1 electron transfer flavoprotein beta subunit/FixA family protein [Paenibacillus protaetiae]